MSAFVTKLPVDLEAVKKLLPSGSDVESVSLNNETKEVELRWSNDSLTTGYTVHLDWPLALLQEGKRPDFVKDRTIPKAVDPLPEQPKPEKKGRKK